MNIKLWEDSIPYYNEKLDTPNSMIAYLNPTWYPLPAVVIFPGGAYKGREEHEGEHIAKYYQSKGLQAFVVNYRLFPNQFSGILADAQRAIKHLRKNAGQYKVDPNRIYAVGFSAGGHLAACTAMLEDCSKIGDTYDDVDARPNGVILGYPVITGVQPNGEDRSCIRQFNEDAAFLEALSLDKRVTKNTPPCFIWHTFEDKNVDVRESLMLAEALKEKGVSFELHVFPRGAHGLGLAQLYDDLGKWPQLSVEWMCKCR